MKISEILFLFTHCWGFILYCVTMPYNLRILMKPLISILNLKHGTGTSAIAWNLAHILELDLYQHDEALHHLFLEERKEYVENGTITTRNISVFNINKRNFESGVYDLGADINYGYVRQIIAKSGVIIIPIEVSAESLIKTIATIKYVAAYNEDADIYVVFNKLDNKDSARERKYTGAAKDKISDLLIDTEEIDKERIKFFYIRYAFAMFRELDKGYFLIDNYLFEDSNNTTSNFELLQHLRYTTLKKNNSSTSKNIPEATPKIKRERVRSDFYNDHTPIYKEFEQSVDVSSLFDGIFIANNQKIVKDMLILSTYVKRKLIL